MFMEMLQRIDEQAISNIYKLKPASEPTRIPRGQMVAAKQSTEGMGVASAVRSGAGAEGDSINPVRNQTDDVEKPRPVHVEKKVGRNEPCPCGSGKKYKHCHGKIE